jgi:hypothetical protein
MMGQTDLAGGRRAAAADQAGLADCVMGCAEGAQKHERLVWVEPPDGAINARCFDAFFRRQIGKDGSQPLGEERFAGSRGADHQ